MKRHLLLFLGMFLFLAIGMHFQEWISHPIEHTMALPSAGAYGLGVLHPLVFTFAGYVVLILLMAIGRVVRRLGSR